VLAFATSCATNNKCDVSTAAAFFLPRSTNIKSSFLYNFSLSLKNPAPLSAREPGFVYRCRINVFALNDTFTAQHITHCGFSSPLITIEVNPNCTKSS
jgi:hypothetical protein